ncbi:MAG TPA: 2-hydroxyacid dehydrogenase [Candidatus Pelethocola excrementipullorum]|nr:2-hydroxyacid dehydrogenase [Candidatus Pelethocola excrementipullorum]
MKIAIKGNRDRYIKFAPDMELFHNSELIFLSRDAGDEEVLREAGDAEILFVDAITEVSGKLMQEMKKLRLVHSEGVAYNKIDLETAKELGIFVCNNKGVNAGAVAEQTILLMLACLRYTIDGDAKVRAGKQIQTKEERMVSGITDLADCKVGLVGFGDIGKATAKRLEAFGCELYYYSKNRKTPEIEEEFKVTYLSMEKLAATCDIISLHAAVTEETQGMINAQFLARMKKNAYLINTARGDLVDNAALRAALIHGTIAGAGLDTIDPEPVLADHPLVALPEGVREKVVYSPHLGGITIGSFRRMHRNMWENANRVARCERPNNVVNGLETFR